MKLEDKTQTTSSSRHPTSSTRGRWFGCSNPTVVLAFSEGVWWNFHLKMGMPMISGHFRRFHAFPSSGFPRYFVIWHDDYNDYDYDYYYYYYYYTTTILLLLLLLLLLVWYSIPGCHDVDCCLLTAAFRILCAFRRMAKFWPWPRRKRNKRDLEGTIFCFQTIPKTSRYLEIEQPQKNGGCSIALTYNRT